MTERYSRRALLASLGSLAVAGCTADGQADDGGTRTGTGTGTNGEPDSTSTPASDATAATDSAPTTPGDEEPTATPEPGPTTPEGIDADWPMPEYDPGLSNYSPTPGPTEPVAELWSVTTGTGLSAPVLADGTLFVGGDDGVVRALDAATGERRWQASVGSGAGTPWVVDGRLFVPTSEEIVALGTDDGAEAWRVDAPNRADVLVADHGVYWLTMAPTVVAVSREGGSERWRADLRDPWEPPLFAGPESVFVSTGQNGRIPWTFDPGTGDVVGSEPDRGYDFPEERFYLDGAVYGVDPFFGVVHGEDWSRGVEGVGEYAISGGADRVYYVASDGDRPGLYALARTNGTIEWQTDAAAAFVGRPVVTDRCVLVRTDDALVCFDPADGSERWSRPAEGVGERFVVADDLLYTTRDGAVRAFRPA